MNIEINELFAIQNKLVSQTPLKFKRYLFEKINWENRMITITGARGTGKTTLVLQHFKEKYKTTAECLYMSADNPLVLKNGVYNIATEYFKYYGDAIIIDEVHKQTNWSSEVKALYDAFPDKKIIILGSSRLNILNQKGDLSRRTLIYNLKGLSFREFLELKYEINFSSYNLEEILSDHIKISSDLFQINRNVLKHFMEYKQIGFYPFFTDVDISEYQVILNNVLDKVIYEDVPALKDIKSSSQVSLKKLIAYLSISKIPTINIGSMCNELDIPKETLYEFLDLLARADLVNIIKKRDATVRSLKKSRIFLSNPNLYYAISNELWKHNVDVGNIRESFFVSQLNELYLLYSSQIADYSIYLKTGKDIEVEIGGKTKSRKQIMDTKDGYVFRDDQEMGYDNIIPLYLTGFLY
ncbi:MAG: ATP-binding protein [Candidatus Cloacimonetes bacterium]|nr:ATP-binding protein [Candidatus Cloacimonadota bacterium]